MSQFSLRSFQLIEVLKSQVMSKMEHINQIRDEKRDIGIINNQLLQEVFLFHSTKNKLDACLLEIKTLKKVNEELEERGREAICNAELMKSELKMTKKFKKAMENNLKNFEENLKLEDKNFLNEDLIINIRNSLTGKLNVIEENEELEYVSMRSSLNLSTGKAPARNSFDCKDDRKRYTLRIEKNYEFRGNENETTQSVRNGIKISKQTQTNVSSIFQKSFPSNLEALTTERRKSENNFSSKNQFAIFKETAFNLDDNFGETKRKSEIKPITQNERTCREMANENLGDVYKMSEIKPIARNDGAFMQVGINNVSETPIESEMNQMIQNDAAKKDIAICTIGEMRRKSEIRPMTQNDPVFIDNLSQARRKSEIRQLTQTEPNSIKKKLFSFDNVIKNIEETKKLENREMPKFEFDSFVISENSKQLDKTLQMTKIESRLEKLSQKNLLIDEYLDKIELPFFVESEKIDSVNKSLNDKNGRVEVNNCVKLYCDDNPIDLVEFGDKLDAQNDRRKSIFNIERNHKMDENQSLEMPKRYDDNPIALFDVGEKLDAQNDIRKSIMNIERHHGRYENHFTETLKNQEHDSDINNSASMAINVFIPVVTCTKNIKASNLTSNLIEECHEIKSKIVNLKTTDLSNQISNTQELSPLKPPTPDKKSNNDEMIKLHKLTNKIELLLPLINKLANELEQKSHDISKKLTKFTQIRKLGITPEIFTNIYLAGQIAKLKNAENRAVETLKAQHRPRDNSVKIAKRLTHYFQSSEKLGYNQTFRNTTAEGSNHSIGHYYRTNLMLKDDMRNSRNESFDYTSRNNSKKLEKANDFVELTVEQKTKDFQRIQNQKDTPSSVKMAYKTIQNGLLDFEEMMVEQKGKEFKKVKNQKDAPSSVKLIQKTLPDGLLSMVYKMKKRLSIKNETRYQSRNNQPEEGDVNSKIYDKNQHQFTLNDGKRARNKYQKHRINEVQNEEDQTCKTSVSDFAEYAANLFNFSERPFSDIDKPNYQSICEELKKKLEKLGFKNQHQIYPIIEFENNQNEVINYDWKQKNLTQDDSFYCKKNINFDFEKTEMSQNRFLNEEKSGKPEIQLTKVYKEFKNGKPDIQINKVYRELKNGKADVQINEFSSELKIEKEVSQINEFSKEITASKDLTQPHHSSTEFKTDKKHIKMNNLFQNPLNPSLAHLPDVNNAVNLMTNCFTKIQELLQPKKIKNDHSSISKPKLSSKDLSFLENNLRTNVRIVDNILQIFIDFAKRNFFEQGNCESNKRNSTDGIIEQEMKTKFYQTHIKLANNVISGLVKKINYLKSVKNENSQPNSSRKSFTGQQDPDINQIGNQIRYDSYSQNTHTIKQNHEELNLLQVYKNFQEEIYDLEKPNSIMVNLENPRNLYNEKTSEIVSKGYLMVVKDLLSNTSLSCSELRVELADLFDEIDKK